MKKIIIITLLLSIGKFGYSQLNPMGSVYYHNQYAANPAMAGLVEGWELNAAVKAQWTVIENGISMQTVSAAHGAKNKKVGFGMLFYNELAGVVQRTSAKGTYAYHLPLNNKSTFIDFGLSAGIMDENINMSKVLGDLTDVQLGNFNDRKTYLDVDFGIAFRTAHLTIQGALPNLKRVFGKDVVRNVVDQSLSIASISYKIIPKEGALNSIEPKLVYRTVENYKDIIDFGSNFVFSDSRLLLSGVYHSTGSVTFGAGTVYRNKLTILAQYTTNTKELGSYSNGEAEIGLKYNFR